MPLPRVVPLEEERMHELFGAAGLELQARELPFTTAVCRSVAMMCMRLC